MTWGRCSYVMAPDETTPPGPSSSIGLKRLTLTRVLVSVILFQVAAIVVGTLIVATADRGSYGSEGCGIKPPPASGIVPLLAAVLIGFLSIPVGLFALAAFKWWPPKLRLLGFSGLAILLGAVALLITVVVSYSNCG